MEVRVDSHIFPHGIEIMLLSDSFPLSIGTAEASEIKPGIYYFNRLFIVPKYRGNKYGTILLDELLKIIKENNIRLMLDINPYGEMSYKQLEKFYIRHGFIKDKYEKHRYSYE